MLSFGARAIKYFLFLLNLIYVITGIVFIFIGAAIRSKYTDYEHLIDPRVHNLSIVLICVGFVIFVISFLGCCGACTENRFMILLFSTLISVILLIEGALAIVGYVYAAEANAMVVDGFKSTLPNYNTDNETREEWDLWQTNLNCCGVLGPFDWEKSNMTIPWSCCEGPGGSNSSVVECSYKVPTIHRTGCLTALTDLVKGEMEHIGNAGLILALIHLASVFMSCYLARAIKTSQYESV